MARQKRKEQPQARATQPRKRRTLLALVISSMVIASVALVAYLTLFPNGRCPASPFASVLTVTRKARNLEALLAMTPEQVAQVDIAEMNLLCATGLPGAEKLDVDKCLATLQRWAERVKSETERHLYRVHDPQWADHYKRSENWLRAEFLAQVLQEDLGVHYNMERVRNIDFKNSKDLFVHGLINDPNGGTCVSMPALYVAVGRRLGYPLKLVLSKAHVFARWDDGKERFNIEVSEIGGVDSFPDSHYTQWPERISAAEVKANRYLISLSPAEELASFLASRGHCLLDNGRAREAQDAYATAHRLAPLDPAYYAWMRQAQVRFRPPSNASGPGGFREPPMRHRIEDVEEINAQNRQMMEKLMHPPTPPSVPQPYRPPAAEQTPR